MHTIQLVNSTALPLGHDFMVLQAGVDNVTFYRETAISAETIESAWAALTALRAMSV